VAIAKINGTAPTITVTDAGSPPRIASTDNELSPTMPSAAVTASTNSCRRVGRGKPRRHGRTKANMMTAEPA